MNQYDKNETVLIVPTCSNLFQLVPILFRLVSITGNIKFNANLKHGQPPGTFDCPVEEEPHLRRRVSNQLPYLTYWPIGQKFTIFIYYVFYCGSQCMKPALFNCQNVIQAFNSLCRWFTYFQEFSVCSLLFDCPSIDESCEDCLSGEYRCKDQQGISFKIRDQADLVT